MKKKKIIIIGGGASGLVAADFLASSHEVHLYEKGKTVGRKFLVAGKGGFNLTNAAQDANLINAYTSSSIFENALLDFDSLATRQYFQKLGISTFVGSSGRVFPQKGIKPIEVLNTIKRRLEQKGVSIHYNHCFIGFNEQMQPIIQYNGSNFVPDADKYLFALGGASWSVTGSDGSWLSIFKENNIPVVDFEAANCGLNILWEEDFKLKKAGQPLKNIALTFQNKTVKGEAVITKYGLEGNAIYPLASSMNRIEKPILYVDLKPQLSEKQLLQKLEGKNIIPKNYAYTFNLRKVKLQLLKHFTNKEEYTTPHLFVQKLKYLAIPVQSLRPIEEAISTIGGVELNALNADFSLKDFPHIHTIGEMVNWDAPTGGFLLQGCFSSGVAAARSIL